MNFQHVGMYFLREGTSVRFPIKFCETRWIEDREVAEWALQNWDSVVATVRFWVGLCKSKQPRNNKSYDTLVTHHQDLFMPAKLHIFAFIAGILKPFVVLFQNDKTIHVSRAVQGFDLIAWVNFQNEKIE